MKFFVSNDLKKEKNLARMIKSLLLFLGLFIISDLLVKGSTFGYVPTQIIITLQGDTENFIEPYAFNTLLEMIHTDLFFAMMLFILSGALYFRVKNKNFGSLFFMAALLILIIISMTVPFLALYYAWVSYIWYLSFIAWHTLLLFIFTDITLCLREQKNA